MVHLKSIIEALTKQIQEFGVNLKRMNSKDIALLSEFIDTVPQIVWLNDFQQLNPTLLNTYGLEYYGYSKEDLSNLGFNLYNDLIHPENFNDIRTSMNYFVNNPKNILIQPYRSKVKNDVYKWTIACMKSLNFTKKGLPKFVISITFDIDNLVDNLYNKSIDLPINEKFIDTNKHLYSQLSVREIETLKLIGKAYTSNEIASKLNISESTVITHRANIMRKLKTKNINEIVKFAILFHPEII